MKLLPIEERKQYTCYFCGTNKSVKYKTKINTGDVVYCCNRCILLSKEYKN